MGGRGEDGSYEVYQRLLDFERELDWKIVRKQTQIADAAFKVSKVKRTLKVYVSHQAENQPSFGMATTPETPPSWTLRIDARIESYGRQGRSATRPFSHFLRSVVVEMGDAGGDEGMDMDTDEGEGEDKHKDKDDKREQRGARRGAASVVEWNKTATTGETDGFEIRRIGAVDVPVRILLRLDYQPERFRLSPELASVVDLELATRPQVVLALWQYIKLHRLQESEERKVVNNDATLQRLFGVEKMTFSEIPARLDPHLLPPEPIELHYVVAVGRVEGSAIWDIDVELDDPAKPRPISANLVAQQREIALLEQKIAEVMTALRASAVHERVLRSFARDPVECVRKLVAAQCADVEVALGEPSITLDDLSRAQNFDSEDIERAVSLFVASTKSP